MTKLFRWVLVLIFLSLLALWGFGVFVFESKGTDVAYQTSDGAWADNEVLFKGRNFPGIVLGYEIYKIACNAPGVELQRITEKPNIFTVSWWFDDFSSPKWQVPLAEIHPNLVGKSYYRPKDKKHCANQSVSKEQIAQAKNRAKQYIRSLQIHYQ